MMRPCLIPGCSKPVHARNWCRAHYCRWEHHGDPLGGTARGEPERYFRDIVLTYEGTDCLIWPYGRGGDGYARMMVDGVSCLVHRRACTEVRGPAPTSKHESAHSCGRGDHGCVSPIHLDWKTHAENQADMLKHGTTRRGELNPHAKIKDADAQEIRRLLNGGASRKAVAERFDISPQIVARVHRRTSWAWLP